MNTKEMTKPELIEKLDAILKVIERGPKVSEPDSAVNRAHNNEAHIEAIELAAGVVR